MSCVNTFLNIIKYVRYSARLPVYPLSDVRLINIGISSNFTAILRTSYICCLLTFMEMLNGKCAFNCKVGTKRERFRNETEKSRTSKFINLHFHRKKKQQKMKKLFNWNQTCPIEVNVIHFGENVSSTEWK